MIPERRPIPTIAIAIVNWNAGDRLRQCLTSIAGATLTAVQLVRVIVVDNASTDRSAEGLTALQLPLNVVLNPENRGFAAACNQAVEGLAADYLLFLNPDTRLLPEAVTRAVDFLEAIGNGSVGIVGAQLVDDSGAIARTCARFPTPWTCFTHMIGLDRVLPALCQSYVMSEWDHQATREVDHVMGAFYLVRGRVFGELGGFDQRFFVYLEDVDFSLRARQAGWRTFFVADARAYHRGGGASERIKATRLYYSLRSRLLYARKHFTGRAATAITAATLCAEPLVRLLACALGESPTGVRETLAAYRMLWRTSLGPAFPAVGPDQGWERRNS